VSNDVELVETVPEALGSGDVVNLTQTEDVLIFLVSESGSVDFEQAVLIGKASISEQCGGLGGRDDVQVVVFLYSLFTSCSVFESGFEGLFVDLNELGVELYVYAVLLEVLLDELVSSVEVLAESVVGIGNGEVVDGGKLTTTCVPSPDFSSVEEVERGDFTLIRERRNGVDSISVCEVIDPSLMLHIITLPTGMFSMRENGMVKVSQSFFEALDTCKILVKTSSNDQMVILNSSSTSEDNSVLFG